MLLGEEKCSKERVFHSFIKCLIHQLIHFSLEFLTGEPLDTL